MAHKDLLHLTEEQIKDLIKRYYNYEKISDLLAEFEINVYPIAKPQEIGTCYAITNNYGKHLYLLYKNENIQSSDCTYFLWSCYKTYYVTPWLDHGVHRKKINKDWIPRSSRGMTLNVTGFPPTRE